MSPRHLWATLLLVAVPTYAAAATPTLDELLKPAEHTLVAISPGGTYLAVTKRIDDRVMLAIIDRESNSLIRTLDPKKDGAVAHVEWVSDERLMLMNSRVGPRVYQPYLEPQIVAINADGSRRRAFYASVVDTLIDDDENILILRCAKQMSDGCWYYVQRSNNDGGRGGERVADAPMVNASMMSDHVGQVRFAHGWDDDGIQQTWMLEDGKWARINDETATGIEVLPIGVSRDGKSGFLRSEQRSGPDVIERIVFATGERDVVMSDPTLDPLYVVWSADRTQPIGAAYGTGVPRARFWDAADPDAVLLRQLEAAFPEDAVAFGSGSRDGKHVVVLVWSDRDPGSYYLLDRDARKTALLTRAKPWLSPDTIAPTTPVSFRGRDGTELDGYLTLPLSYAGSGYPPPLVVMPHGGPFGVRDGWGYDAEVQILAAHGYSTLRVNYRGSSGRGRAFEEAGFRQWGAKMQDDVIDATRSAIDNGHADASRTCIWGASYGGYAALMGAALAPDLYQCAVATSAVTDLNLSWRWGDIQRSTRGKNFLAETMGSDPALLRSASPVAHAADIPADVLLVHGRMDRRVSYEHAKAMLAAFERVGKRVDHEVFLNETHGVYGDENRTAYYQRVLGFLRKNIGRKPTVNLPP